MKSARLCKKKLKDMQMDKLYQDIEFPLAKNVIRYGNGRHLHQ